MSPEGSKLAQKLAIAKPSGGFFSGFSYVTRLTYLPKKRKRIWILTKKHTIAVKY